MQNNLLIYRSKSGTENKYQSETTVTARATRGGTEGRKNMRILNYKIQKMH